MASAPIPRIIGFSYSIGFWESLNTPDMIVFGAWPEDAFEIFSQAFDDVRSGALVPRDMATWPPHGDRHLILRAVHPSQLRRAFFNSAIWYFEDRGRQREDFSALQIVFPDKQGVFPWEAGYDQDYEPRQMALWKPCPQENAEDWSMAADFAPPWPETRTPPHEPRD